MSIGHSRQQVPADLNAARGRGSRSDLKLGGRVIAAGPEPAKGPVWRISLKGGGERGDLPPESQPPRGQPLPSPERDTEIFEMARRFDKLCGDRSNRSLAGSLGVSYETVRRYRRGQTAVPAYIVARACRVLRVSPSCVLDGDDRAETSPPATTGRRGSSGRR
jgi:transcriptional regulator with XRE-family HTH domain